MKVKIFIFSLILATTLITGLSAIDWGGTVDNSSSVTYAAGDQWLQEDKLGLWFSTSIGSSLEFTAQGSYTFSY
ncbi:MAG: hypothetical protein JSV89_19620, partial [Spirochaetaceae bacterium]